MPNIQVTVDGVPVGVVAIWGEVKAHKPTTPDRCRSNSQRFVNDPKYPFGRKKVETRLTYESGAVVVGKLVE